jgi:thymidylate synthase (FAD)
MNNQTVKLVGLTYPTIEGINTLEEFIAYVARVSNPANQSNSLTSNKLLKYLIKHQHWSPFEMAHAVLEISTTRDIARQILRHRSFAFQEFSQRYADPTQLGFSIREARLQDTKNRQNSIETSNEELEYLWKEKQLRVINAATDAYTFAINNGIAKEQARSVLPEGNTNSRLYMAGTIRSWIHYILLRAGNGTQKEHRDIAIKASAVFTEQLPSLSEIVFDEDTGKMSQ